MSAATTCGSAMPPGTISGRPIPTDRTAESARSAEPQPDPQGARRRPFLDSVPADARKDARVGDILHPCLDGQAAPERDRCRRVQSEGAREALAVEIVLILGAAVPRGERGAGAAV